MTIRRISMTMLLAALLLAAPSARAQDDATMDHAAMASSYQEEAKAAQEKAERHQLMLDRYEKMPTLPKGTSATKDMMVKHCQKLVDSYQQSAAQATDLAKLHQQAAEASK